MQPIECSCEHSPAEAQPHLLDFMGVQEEDALALVAHKVEGAGGAPPHNAGALRPPQHFLQLRHIPAIHLHRQIHPSHHESPILQTFLADWQPFCKLDGLLKQVKPN